MFRKRIPKIVIKPDEIESNDCFGLNLNENTITCSDCGSHLFYIKKELGVVAEEHDYGIWNNRSNRIHCVRTVGVIIYCAECGAFNEHYRNFCFDKDNLICTWDELGGCGVVEIKHCLHQWDQKGDFKPQWKCSEVITLKEKLKEYEKKHPIKNEKKKPKRRK